MNQEGAKSSDPSISHVAEAAAWMAHLHNSGRTADSDRGHHLWLNETPARQRAWEAATDVWEDLRRLPTSTVIKELESARRKIKARRRRHAGMLAGVAVGVLVGVVTFWATRDTVLATDIGEQRTMSLKDGTQVTLNTGTRLIVRYEGRLRHVELTRGEALFDVASHRGWPFVVRAGDHKITVLGTAFVVRRDQNQVSIMLMDGKLAVSGARQESGSDSLSHAQEIPSVSQGELILAPGQRLTLAERAAPKLDQPSVDKVTAWRRGKVVFEGIRLADAVAEMNRYNARQLSLQDRRAAELRISGVFKYGESLRFADAVATTYGLRVVEADDQISLVGAPQAAYQ